MYSLRDTGLLFIVLCGLFATAAHAATQTLEWNVTYLNANPDGLFERQVMGVNGAWPPPNIELNYGDRLVLTVNNQLPDVTTGVHAHGLFQNGTNYYDGPVGVVQCGIPPGESLTYNFTVQQNGTYWIHSHVMGQYPDGLRSAFIIHNPEEPYEYDEDITITLSDWYHDTTTQAIASFMSYKNPTGAEPIPTSCLMNDTQNSTINFEPGKTYRLRFVNLGAFPMFYVWLEEHDMQVIELDGVYTEPYTVQGFQIATAQRVSVLITAKNTTDRNFALVASMDTSMFDYVPDGLNWNVTSWIVYNQTAPNDPAELIESYHDWDDTLLTPLEPQSVVDADESYQLDVDFNTLDNGENYASFNSISYMAPIVPTILTALSAPANYTNDVIIYGTSTNAHVLTHNHMVEIVLNNYDTGKHPFHLHGHTFQVVYRSEEDEGPYNDSMQLTFPENPMRRDTIQVKPGGFLILRFRADNPGIWLFHCHIEWHVVSGLVATFVEAPTQIQQNIKFPDVMYQQCQKQNIPISGNAANHSDVNGDWLDLTGEPRAPNPLPGGFTTKGYLGMAGCCVAAVMGMATIIWYGITDPEDKKAKKPFTITTAPQREENGGLVDQGTS